LPYFILEDRTTTQIYTFPYTTLFRSTQEDRQPEVQTQHSVEGKGQVGADHEERTVGKVEYPEHAEGDRKSGGQEPQVHRVGKADQALIEVDLHADPPGKAIRPQGSRRSPSHVRQCKGLQRHRSIRLRLRRNLVLAGGAGPRQGRDPAD